MNQINKRCLKVLDTYWNERLSYLAQSDRLDDADNILSSIDSNSVDKILICARRTSQIVRLFADSKLGAELYGRGYNWMYITAKTGAVINGIKVSRVKFFETLNKWGKDNTRFVVLHHSILSEGINVNGLEAVLFLRSMNYTPLVKLVVE